MQTEDLEQKKLVYLYLMNYAKTQPELVILAVNTFVKDADDANPLVRALAIRTMGVLRAEKIIDYLADPLQKALRDENPYVRKTAALCVAKLYDLKPELVLDNGFLEQLHDMIGDSNPMVRAARRLPGCSRRADALCRSSRTPSPRLRTSTTPRARRPTASSRRTTPHASR
jgi:AP-1 complex subunit beta-1